LKERKRERTIFDIRSKLGFKLSQIMRIAPVRLSLLFALREPHKRRQNQNQTQLPQKLMSLMWQLSLFFATTRKRGEVIL
jgi:hypothetical protein